MKALIFDLDGTLYRQGPVRRAMLLRLIRGHLLHPWQGLTTLRSLRAYRQSQEELRDKYSDSGDIARAQLLRTASQLGMPAEAVASCVAQWMEREPLSLLAGSLRAGTFQLLEEARRCGLRLAVFSDYPADRKLAAMGIARFFDIVVTAQDPQVQHFKPHPKGLEVTLRRLSVRNQEAVYIGDRADVDALAASRAGIRHFILRPRQSFDGLLKLLTSQDLHCVPGG